MISASNISFSIKDKLILNNVSLDLHPGKVATIIGPSGSGKTTLLRALCLLDHPDSGHLGINGNQYKFPLRSKNDFAIPWPNVTFVFQELYLWPHLTLKENILLPYRVKGPEAIKVIENEFNELIATLELQDCIKRRPHQASGGEKQRAAIARAILLHPHFLLLDEITSALDIEQVAIILNLLAQLRKNSMGMIIVTHHYEFAKRVSDTVIFLDKGAIVESGAPSILDNPQSPRLVEFLEFIKKAW
jgi:ABC-type polar amino acid transport system ATPase subunit